MFLALLAAALLAPASALAAPSAAFELSVPDPCVAGDCSATVSYDGNLLSGPVHVDVDWGAGFEATKLCVPGLTCVLRGPVYESAGEREVAVRVTDLLGESATSSQPLKVSARLLRPVVPADGDVLQGVSGSTSAQPYSGQVAHRLDVFGVFVRWGSLGNYVFDAARGAGQLMLHVSTSQYQGGPEQITPLGIARGQGDEYLLRINRRLSAWGKPAYVRFLAEMNQAHSSYAAFNANGSSRGRSHSTAAFKQAWRRATLIIRGGPVATVNSRLRKLHLPPLRTARDRLPQPQVAMVWVPQTRGTPDIPANMPAAYWPGGRYVDWIGTDFYSRYPNFDWLTQFYARFRAKPFVLAEWALWGSDDPGFVRRLFGWVRAHPRVKMMLYNQGGSPSGPFRLNRYPLSRAELRRQLTR